MGTQPQTQHSEVNPDKLMAFMGKLVGDLGAMASITPMIIGEKLGLYKALVKGGPMTSAELAKATDLHERNVREWLYQQAASGLMQYDAATTQFSMTPEQGVALGVEESPFYFMGAVEVAIAMVRSEEKLLTAFRTGSGVGWHEHDACLFRGTERFFRPGYMRHLLSEWIPALDGVKAKLEAGARVADVGCGHGSSSILMAQAFPNSHVYGYDYHGPSIERARKTAEAAGVGGRTTFEVASAKNYPGKDYDLVTFFDCLHDMGDPAGAAAHVHSTLAKDGTWMVVEPMADDKVENNLNALGRVFFAASTCVCTPASMAQEVGLALGAQAGEGRLTKVIAEGGFRRIRRVAETPFNMVLEARL
jgi:2-polyprenyl-3-methyl-5-hydroxy-6-metoxy-1,4-benzoquinol methylase